MRLKRQKPRKSSLAKSGSHLSNSRRRKFPQREFGRQIDADLTEASDPADPDSGSDVQTPNSTEFTGADFPEIDPNQQSSAPQEPPPITHAVVRERAMRLLVHREHGRKELEKKLRQRELPQDLIDSVLDQLAEEGLQCDIRFAESYTRMRSDRGYGANKVRADLQSRRLEQSVIEEAISDSGTDWTEVAAKALRKKFEANEFDSNSEASVKTLARMQRFLYQRGFEAEQIRSAMDGFTASHS